MKRIPSFKNTPFIEYLKSYLELLKTQYGGNEVKNWALKAGITSRITFKHILSGRKNLNYNQLKEIADMLDMGQEQRQNLKNPQFDPAQKAVEKYFVNPEFFQSPINTIILNLCALTKPMKLENIFEILKTSFSSEEIEHSIKYLMDLKLLEKNSEGILKRVFHGILTTLPGIKNPSSRDYFKSTFKMADKGWEEPLHMRELSAFTFKIKSEDMPKIKDLMRKLRQDILDFSNASEDTDSVYQCGLAAVPVFVEKQK